MSAEIMTEIHRVLVEHERAPLATPNVALMRIRTIVDRADRFGQCAPFDATPRERLEAASALLMLADPLHLVEALRDAGLRAVTPEAWAVLEECLKVRLTVRALGVDGHTEEPAFTTTTRELARAVHVWRAAVGRAMKVGGAG